MCTQEGALASISPLPISKASFGGSIGVLADWGIGRGLAPLFLELPCFLLPGSQQLLPRDDPGTDLRTKGWTVGLRSDSCLGLQTKLPPFWLPGLQGIDVSRLS